MNRIAKTSVQASVVISVLFTSLLPIPAQNAPFRGRLRQLLENRRAASSRGLTDQKEGTTEVAINSGGLTRIYHIHVTPGYDPAKPAPLVFIFHGGAGTGLGIVKVSQMNIEADRQGFIAIYPDGLNKHWNDGRAKYSNQRRQDDVDFIKDIVRKVESEMNIDKARIYACGLSEGGLISQRLACEAPDVFAAVASLGANFVADSGISPSKPFSIMYILGTSDPFMPFKGGDIRILFGKSRGKVLSADQSVATWVNYDRCPPTPVVCTYGQPGANLSIESRTYGPGINGSEVVYCVVRGGGHCWQGGVQYLRKNNWLHKSYQCQ